MTTVIDVSGQSSTLTTSRSASISGVIPDLASERSERRVSGIHASVSMTPKPMQKTCTMTRT